jgi:hypothetical protein
MRYNSNNVEIDKNFDILINWCSYIKYMNGFSINKLLDC